MQRQYLDPVQDSQKPIQVLVCQYLNCVERGSAEVLAALEAFADQQITVLPSSCQGQCHLGVNVHIPANAVFSRDVWYSQVKPEQAEKIIEQHCRQGRPIAALMNPRLHPRF
jgi:(2Fe-2S) ferredoxin